MIERYSRKEVKRIWEDFNKYSIWLEIELAAAEAMEKLKVIPKGVVKKVKSKAKINVKRIQQIEEKVKHDVIAFLTSITEKAGKEAKYLHRMEWTDEVGQIPMTYNWLEGDYPNDINPKVIHFTNGGPWHETWNGDYSEKWIEVYNEITN